MCGIVGYIGQKQALPVLLNGLKRLEYRGYDSSGIVVVSKKNIKLVKSVGKIVELENKIKESGDLSGEIGIAHTRWATHGEPNEANAHPHTCCNGKIFVAHNGIIENFQKLKKDLEAKGHIFKSDTDTEVIPHLIESLYTGNLAEAVRKALGLVCGAYGLVVLHADEPDKLIAAKQGSPLVIGLGENETIVASDVAAIVSHTRQVIFMEDGEMAVVSANDLKISTLDKTEVCREAQEVEWDVEQIEKNGYPHFMLKEIFEQPEAIANSIRGRMIEKDGKAKLGGLDNQEEKIRKIENIIIAACGTARCAALVGEYMLEEYAGISTEVDYAHEFRYRKPVISGNTALMAISQSGETADTLASVKEAKEKGILTLGIINAVGSSIARSTDAGVYNHIGPEIAVASTKAFASQVAILALMTVFMGRQREMSVATGKRIISELEMMPEKIASILEQDDSIKKIAEKYHQVKNFAYLGRKYNHPSALEGAIKLKELSYIHAEGFAAGELKHGPIAMIDENFPSMYIVPQDSVYEKNISNIQEIKARKGKVIAIATVGDEKIREIADDVIYIPKTLEMLTPILSVVPLQLFAYHIAVMKGLDVDKPRNLAKSVTVE